MCLFIRLGLGDRYKKLVEEDGIKITDVLKGSEMLFLIEYTPVLEDMHVKQNLDSEIIGITEGDTGLSIKLQGQDQLGIAARNIIITADSGHVMNDDHKLRKREITSYGFYKGVKYSIVLRKH